MLLQWFVWSFAATSVLTTILALSQGLRMTRMNIPFLLGTIFHDGSRPATRTGFLVHLVNGWLFGLLYIATFYVWGHATWWIGMIVGLLHSLFVLAAVMPVLPSIHPRMAGAAQGPATIRMLEPPGFLALHYGVRTPVSVVIAHLAYGAILGGFCKV